MFIALVALVAIVILCLAKIALDGKAKIDEMQEKAGRAGGVAASLGFKFFDDLCFAIAAGNIARIKEILLNWFREYAQGEDGPKKLARDVIIGTYPTIRDDAKYGDEVRQTVVYSALGWTPGDKQDIKIAKVGGQAELLGWSKSAEIITSMATHEYRIMGNAIRALANELMEDNGAEKIAARVAPKTLAVLWNDPNFRPAAEMLVREYAAKIGLTGDAAAAGSKGGTL